MGTKVTIKNDGGKDAKDLTVKVMAYKMKDSGAIDQAEKLHVIKPGQSESFTVFNKGTHAVSITVDEESPIIITGEAPAFVDEVTQAADRIIQTGR